MKLSISNIAWSNDDDQNMYSFLKKHKIAGLEIAPTRIFSEKPYEKLEEALVFSNNLKSDYNLSISSLQSICFGITASIFGTEDERNEILNYTKKAIDFASIINCNNLVFGCPKNRIIGENQMDIALDFFGELAEYSKAKNTILALEANPDIYGTNFINTSKEAFDFVKEINHDGLKVNFDFGTFLHQNEKINEIEKHLDLINHVHISEPYLELIQEREIHSEFAKMLIHNNYDKYVSIEMKNQNSIEKVQSTVNYIKQTFDVA